MLTIKTSHLRRALDLGGRAAEKRTTIPALGMVRLTTDASRELLHVESTNMDICATASAPCDTGTRKIDVCLPDHRAISKALREIGGEDTTIEHEVTTSPHKSGEITTHTVLIASGEFKCKLDGRPAFDFPVWNVKGADTFKVEVGADFARALEKVRGACSQEETRYYLNGVHIGPLNKDGYHPLVATDGHRMHKVDFPLPGLEGEVPVNIIIPRGFLSLAVPLMIEAAKKEPVAMSMIGGKALALKLALGEVALHLRTKLIDGTFPDYTRVIPAKTKHSMVVQVDALRRAVVAISPPGGKEVNKGILLSCDKDHTTLILSACWPEGQSSMNIPIEATSGTWADIGFNAKHILSAINTLGGPTVRLLWGDAEGPSIWRQAEDDQAMVLTMPMRI